MTSHQPTPSPWQCGRWFFQEIRFQSMNSEVAKWTYRCSGTSLRNLNLLIFFWYSLDKFDEKGGSNGPRHADLKKNSNLGVFFRTMEANWSAVLEKSVYLFPCWSIHWAEMYARMADGELLRIYISVTSVFEEMIFIAICSGIELQERGSGHSMKPQLGYSL